MQYYDNDLNRRQFVTHLIKFDKDQLFEINLGHLLGLSVDQITLYARPEFQYTVMRHIKQALIEQLDIEKVKYMADPKFSYPQMILIKTAFDEGFTIDEVKSFSEDTSLTYAQMRDIYTDISRKKQAMG